MIKALSARHFKIVDLAVKGYTPQMVAVELNMSQPHVSVIFNSPTFKHELALRRSMYEERVVEKQIDEEDEVLKSLKAGAVQAAKKLVNHVNSTDDSISVKSCAEVLDRTGYTKKVEKKEASNVPIIIINAKDAGRIVESIEMDSEQASISESSDLTPVTS